MQYRLNNTLQPGVGVYYQEEVVKNLFTYLSISHVAANGTPWIYARYLVGVSPRSFRR